MDAEGIIAALGLQPHPEDGHYRETWRAEAGTAERAAGSAIYFLLKAGEVSRWHRVDAAEIWHFHAGSPLELVFERDGRLVRETLGADLAAGERPQVVVPPHGWQTARSLGQWTLVGCTVSPAFEFDKFELAPEGWEPDLSRA